MSLWVFQFGAIGPRGCNPPGRLGDIRGITFRNFRNLFSRVSCFLQFIFAALKNILVFLCVFSKFWGLHITFLQVSAIYIFKNVQFRGINFRDYLNFARFRGIYFRDFCKNEKISSAKIRSAKIYAREN